MCSSPTASCKQVMKQISVRIRMKTFDEKLNIVCEIFENLTSSEQVETIKALLIKCQPPQLNTVQEVLQTQLLYDADFSQFLPQELITKIFSYLSAGELSRVACSNKHWRDVANCDVLWQKFCRDKGWLHYGIDHDLSMEQPSPRSKGSAISSPTFSEDNLIRFPSTLNPTCRWKEVFIRAAHLDKNWATGCYKIALPLRGHRGKVTCIDSDGQIIVSGSTDGTVRVWDVFSGQCLDVINGHSDSVTCLQMMDTEVITGCADSIISVFEISSATCKKILNGHEKGIIDLKCDGKHLVSSAGDFMIRIWSWPSGSCQHILSGHVDEIETLSLYEGLVMSTSWDSSCKLWDINQGICIQTLSGHTEIVFCCQFDDVKAVTGAGDGTLKIWNLTTGECTDTLIGHQDDVYCLQYDEDVIASGSADSTVILWNHSGECLRVMDGHIGVVRCLRLMNGRLVTGGDRKKIMVWDGKVIVVAVDMIAMIWYVCWLS
ncbi:putative F-box/WD repeat-containing protein 7-like [Apostichopus japonicus]|uniref:Putative F-box/WD repeat-containing protein 7-like n=1 Tax=Stichopus japonicus TaxID=307972 RepID=A0A2G8KCC1_STIJA|nr:putative F-box/WD repeat-containing protein 7-like [Apostichopus japonicus]